MSIEFLAYMIHTYSGFLSYMKEEYYSNFKFNNYYIIDYYNKIKNNSHGYNIQKYYDDLGMFDMKYIDKRLGK